MMNWLAEYINKNYNFFLPYLTAASNIPTHRNIVMICSLTTNVGLPSMSQKLMCGDIKTCLIGYHYH